MRLGECSAVPSFACGVPGLGCEPVLVAATRAETETDRDETVAHMGSDCMHLLWLLLLQFGRGDNEGGIGSEKKVFCGRMPPVGEMK